MVSTSSLLLGALIVIAVVAGLYGVGTYTQQHTETITILGKHVDPEGSSTYYIVTSTNGQSFQFDFPWWKVGQNIQNPDVIYDRMDVNSTYCVTYAGWYLPGWPFYWYHLAYNATPGSC